MDGGGGDDIRQGYEVDKTGFLMIHPVKGKQFCKTFLIVAYSVFVLKTDMLLSGRYKQETGTLRYLAICMEDCLDP